MSQSTSNVIVSSIPRRSACEKLESEKYCCDVAGATSAVMRKVGGGDFARVNNVTTLLKMLDMVDVMLLCMWVGYIRGRDGVLVCKEFRNSTLEMWLVRTNDGEMCLLYQRVSRANSLVLATMVPVFLHGDEPLTSSVKSIYSFKNILANREIAIDMLSFFNGL